MRPIHFEESNKQFERPESMEDETYLPISAYVGEDYVNTVWMPNKEDIEAINAGRPIIISHSFQKGKVFMQPHAMFTCDENGIPNE